MEILELAGITINGSSPWDIQIHNDEFCRRAITEGEPGIGESYMDGWWDAEKIDELIYRKISLEPGMRVLDIGCGWGTRNQLWQIVLSKCGVPGGYLAVR